MNKKIVTVLIRHKILFKSIAIVSSTVLTSVFAVLYELKQTLNNINKIVDKSALKLEQRHSQYIYINDLQVKEALVGEEWDEVIGYRYAGDLFRWWSRRRDLMTWRLLEIAQDPYQPREHRIRAVQSLTESSNLQDSDYRHLAQACDAHTAVALARMKNVDLRFFLKPPNRSSYLDKEDLKDALRDLLIKLNKLQKHLCIKYFLTKAFPNSQVKNLSLSFLVDLEFLGMEGPRPLTISEENIIPMCIESLVHHCTINDNAKTLVELGALPLLMEVYNYLNENIEISLLLVKLMVKISLYPEMLQDLFITGWLRVIVKWSKSRDPRLSIPAVSLLANLDRDYLPKDSVYGQEVFLLHPSERTLNEVENVDVVLIHGLLGGVHYTWRQRPSRKPISLFEQNKRAGSYVNWFFGSRHISKGMTTTSDSLESVASRMDTESDGVAREILENAEEEEQNLGSDYEFVLSDIPRTESRHATTCYSLYGEDTEVRKQACQAPYSNCWPRDWLPEDCKGLRIIGVHYDSRLSDWLQWCYLRDAGGRKNLATKSEEMLEQLIDCGVGDRPIVWIVHSMGGLLLKFMLVKAWESDDERHKKFHKKTKAIFFLSTPHFGSPLASLNEASRFLLLPSTEVNELRLNSPVLTKLHSKFLQFLKENPIKVITFAETESVKLTALQLEIQCVPPNYANCGTGEIYEIPCGHMDICKPENRLSFIYQKMLMVIKEIAGSLKKN